jgi:apocytochrome f
MKTLILSVAFTYPIFAQNAFTTARESTGKIVCANCHLSSSEVHMDVPQSVSAACVFTVRLTLPSAISSKQIGGTGSFGGVNVGSVVLMPDGFTIAPGTRLRGAEKLLSEGIFIQPFNSTCNNVVVVGPLDSAALRAAGLLDFPILSRSNTRCCSTSYCPGTCYSLFGGANSGRGQFYPTGDSSNTVRSDFAGLSLRRVLVSSTCSCFTQFSNVPGSSQRQSNRSGLAPGRSLGAQRTQLATGLGSALGGGFGQQESTLVLQRAERLKAILNFSLSVSLSQYSSVSKKRQFEALA